MTMGTKLGRMVVVKYQFLKNGVKRNELSIEEIDKVTRELLDYLSELTVRGITQIDDETVDLYKERVWNLIERVGLLPE
jgi:chorismate mutase